MISEKRKLELRELIQERAVELNQHDRLMDSQIKNLNHEERIYVSHHSVRLLGQSNDFAISMITAFSPALTETILEENSQNKTKH